MTIKVFSHNSLATGIVAIAFGTLLAYFKADFINLFLIAAGILLLVSAITGFIKFFKETKDTENRWAYMPFSIIFLTITGLLLLLCPSFLVTVGEIVIAVFVMILALGKLMLLFELKRSGVKTGIWYYIVPVLLLVASIAAISSPGDVLGSLSVVFGVMIIIFGLTEIFDYIIIHNDRMKKKFGSISVEDAVQDVEYTEVEK